MTPQQEDPPVEDGGLDKGTVEVGHLEPDLAIVTLRGEHDISTRDELGLAFDEASAHANLLIDLTDCSFIDSTVINLLLKAATAAGVAACAQVDR